MPHTRSRRHRRTSPRLVPFLALLAGAPALAADHRQAIRERLATLQNLTASFSTEVYYTPPPDAVAPPPPANAGPIVMGPVKHGIETFSNTFRFVDGLVVADSTLLADNTAQLNGALPLTRSVWSIADGRYEQLCTYTPAQPVTGAIYRTYPVPIPLLWTIDAGLGLRAADAQTYFASAELDRTDLQDRGPDAVTLSRRDERGHRHTWLFDPSRDYALRRYEVTAADGSLLETIECADFERIGRATLPHTVVRRMLRDGGKTPSVIITLHVHRYALPDPQNDRAHMRIDWPKGALVVDTRSGTNRQMIADDQGRLVDRASANP